MSFLQERFRDPAYHKIVKDRLCSQDAAVVAVFSGVTALSYAVDSGGSYFFGVVSTVLAVNLLCSIEAEYGFVQYKRLPKFRS